MSGQPEAVAAARAAARPAPAARRVPRLAFPADRVLRTLATAWLEVRLNLRTPAPWLVGLVLAGFGVLAVYTASDKTSLRLSWTLSAEYGMLAMVLLLFLAAALANRPNRYDLNELLDSKVVASEELIFGRWLGMLAALAVALIFQVTATAIAQALQSAQPVDPRAFALGYARLLPGVLFLTTLAFLLVTVTRILVLGAGLAALVWFVFFAGTEYYPSFLRLEHSQNAGVFLGLTALTLLSLLGLYRGRRRAKKARTSYVLGAAVALTAVVTGLHAGWVALAMPGKDHAVRTWERLRDGRRGQDDPLPNLAWRGQNGQPVSLAGFRGQPLLLAFLQPSDAGLAGTLRKLAALRNEFVSDGLNVLGVVLSDDLNAAAHVETLVRSGLPLASEWGVPGGTGFDPRHPSSSTAWALRIGRTPQLLFVGEDGREWSRDLSLDDAQLDGTRDRLRRMIDGERPQPALPGVPSGLLPPGFGGPEGPGGPVGPGGEVPSAPQAPAPSQEPAP